MRIGVPKEIKEQEYRVGLVPAGVRELVRSGHGVLVEQSAGDGCGVSDEAYRAAGAVIVPEAAAVYAESDLIVKVKEPQVVELAHMRAGQTLFAFLHLAGYLEVAKGLLKAGITGIAYETVQLADGRLPLLTPMSEIAGRLCVQAGGTFLMNSAGGPGVLLGGVPGVAPGRVVVLGAGMVGMNASRVALGLGADVTVLDINVDRLRWLDNLFAGRVQTLASNPDVIAEAIAQADLVVGAVLIPGARAPRLVSRGMLRLMRPHAVVVDVAIDQGGCFETSRPTSHHDPVYEEDGILHYCVANIPGAVARTSTFALTNVTTPYLLALANNGVEEAVRRDAALRAGLNIFHGEVVHPAVAGALGLPPGKNLAASG